MDFFDFFWVAALKESQRERLVTSYQHKFSLVIIPRQIQNKARVGIFLLTGWDGYIYIHLHGLILIWLLLIPVLFQFSLGQTTY